MRRELTNCRWSHANCGKQPPNSLTRATKVLEASRFQNFQVSNRRFVTNLHHFSFEQSHLNTHLFQRPGGMKAFDTIYIYAQSWTKECPSEEALPYPFPIHSQMTCGLQRPNSFPMPNSGFMFLVANVKPPPRKRSSKFETPVWLPLLPERKSQHFIVAVKIWLGLLKRCIGECFGTHTQPWSKLTWTACLCEGMTCHAIKLVDLAASNVGLTNKAPNASHLICAFRSQKQQKRGEGGVGLWRPRSRAARSSSQDLAWRYCKSSLCHRQTTLHTAKRLHETFSCCCSEQTRRKRVGPDGRRPPASHWPPQQSAECGPGAAGLRSTCSSPARSSIHELAWQYCKSSLRTVKRLQETFPCRSSEQARRQRVGPGGRRPCSHKIKRALKHQVPPLHERAFRNLKTPQGKTDACRWYFPTSSCGILFFCRPR